MTDAPDLTPAEADDMLAAEYVLGVLDLPERMAAEARLKTDADFAAMVVAWEAHLAGLNDSFEDVAPSAAVFAGVEARLFPVAPKRRWTVWLGGAVAAGVVALAVIVTLPQPGPAPEVVADLSAQDQGLVYRAAYSDGQLQVTRVSGTRPGAGQDHELWIIAPGAAPVSLGLLQDETLRVNTPRPAAGWVLAVSVEPEGGSTTGAPTGPVIMTAEISA